MPGIRDNAESVPANGCPYCRCLTLTFGEFQKKETQIRRRNRPMYYWDAFRIVEDNFLAKGGNAGRKGSRCFSCPSLRTGP